MKKKEASIKKVDARKGKKEEIRNESNVLC